MLGITYEQAILLALQATVTLCFALIGSAIMWKILGPRIVKKWGSDRILGWLKDLGTPGKEESEENKLLHLAVQTQMAHIFMDVLNDLETPEGRQKYHPFAKHLYSVVQASVFGTWGQIVKGMQERGEDLTGGGGIPGFGSMPPAVLAMAEKALPGVDIGGTMQLMQWLGSQSGKGGNGSEGGFASPDNASASRTGASHRGVTQS